MYMQDNKAINKCNFNQLKSSFIVHPEMVIVNHIVFFFLIYFIEFDKLKHN